jgi:hypothetical protein
MKSVFLISVALCCLAIKVVAQPATTDIRYLSGTGSDSTVNWEFFCTAGRKSGVWTTIPVPSNWELQGFGEYQYGGDRIRATSYPKEQGKYRFKFSVPGHWKNRVVRIVFDGSMTDTEVWINGKSAGPVHQGSFYRFKYDITSLLNFGGQNLLEVTVSKESSNTSVNRAERESDYWNFGGIFRPVFLEAVPTTFIDWTAIDARADGSFLVQLNLAGDLSKPARAQGQLSDSLGRTVGSAFSVDVAQGQSKVELRTTISNPKLWTAETPNLYRVRLTLTGSASAHAVTERFGFRTFEVRAGDGFYLNGQRILLKGANRHSFWPETGRALNRKISYDDVKLIKELNMNAVRMSHYPPDEDFLDLCDELGLYVLDELAGWQKAYDTPTGAKLIAEMIKRDVNHPSILLWDNGNEGGWNRENDDEFARWDPQRREVLHPWEKFRLTNTDHYEKFDSHTRLANGPDIYMPTEFLHGLYDGGIGAGLWDYWELIRKSKVGGGGFLWALVDECVKRTDQNGRLDCAGNRGPDGIVGPYRELEGSFNTVREIWSPVWITPDDSPTYAKPGSPETRTIDVALENRFDFTNLNACTFEWTLARFATPRSVRPGHTIMKTGSLKGPNIPAHASGVLKLSLPENERFHADVLYLTAKSPDGLSLLTRSWPIGTVKPFAPNPGTDMPEITTQDSGDTIKVNAQPLELLISKRTGMLERVIFDQRQLPLANGPKFVAFRRNDRKYEDVAGVTRLRDIKTRKELDQTVIELTYEGALQKLTWRIHRNRTVAIQYEYFYEGVVDMIGVQFDSAADQMRKIRWLGRGPYRVWQNRLHGTTLDVWENNYNDPVPGESWVFPEFKGYFYDWSWARLDIANGRMTFAAVEPKTFLGLFKPKDGVNGLLDLPDIGIAFLDVVPAMRNKFHTTDEIGPQSKPKSVSEVVKRTVLMRFD